MPTFPESSFAHVPEGDQGKQRDDEADAGHYPPGPVGDRNDRGVLARPELFPVLRIKIVDSLNRAVH